MENSRLFKPITIGNVTLAHRVAMAPLTRYRASPEHVPADPMIVDYYKQRASVPGTLLITEGTYISRTDGGYANVPGIYNDAQVQAWRKVTDAVHARGSFIFCQLWALGRGADPEIASAEGFKVKGPSGIPIDSDSAVPEEFTTDEIKTEVQNYVVAAQNAMRAGFDGVELHGANGYLIDQFIQDMSNQRTDAYGGSIENRSRFVVEVATAVAAAIGAKKLGIRLSPYSTYNNMKMQDPVSQFSDVITKIAALDIAYFHLVESRVCGNADVESTEQLDFAYGLWNGPFLIAGGYKPDSARRLVDEEHPDKDIVVIFGRYFISTPDLPFRLRNGIDFTPYKRDTFYIPGSPAGYADYPFSREFTAAQLERDGNMRQ